MRILSGIAKYIPMVSEIHRLRAENEHLQSLWSGEVNRGMVVNYLNYSQERGMTIAMTVPEKARRFLAEIFILALDDAPNFQVGSFEWRTQGYEMTIRRLEGKPVAEVLRDLKEENERLKKERAA